LWKVVGGKELSLGSGERVRAKGECEDKRSMGLHLPEPSNKRGDAVTGILLQVGKVSKSEEGGGRVRGQKGTSPRELRLTERDAYAVSILLGEQGKRGHERGKESQEERGTQAAGRGDLLHGTWEGPAVKGKMGGDKPPAITGFGWKKKEGGGGERRSRKEKRLEMTRGKNPRSIEIKSHSGEKKRKFLFFAFIGGGGDRMRKKTGTCGKKDGS